MERSEKIGLGVAAAGHVLLFGVLSLGLFSSARLPPRESDPIDVMLTDEIGLVSAAPNPATEAPQAAEAPDNGPPEDAAPSEPEPVPPEPTPAPPAPKAQPKAKAEPKIKSEPKAKADPKRPVAATKSETKAEAPGKGKAERAKGSRLGRDFLKGIATESEGRGEAPRAAISGAAMAGLNAAIARQVQPCYELGALGGTPAMEIVTVMRLRFNRDGSVAGAPTVVEQTGLNAANQGYARQIAEVARRAVQRCAPLRLPANLYEGGWEDVEFTFRPRQFG